MITPEAPITEEDIKQMAVPEIAKKLKTEWKPEKLDKQNTAEGVGNLLKRDIHNRLQEYASNASNFFDRYRIHSHYVYSLILGFQETIKEEPRVIIPKINWDGVIDLCNAIKKSGLEKNFEETKRESFLVDWKYVHVSIDNLIQELIPRIEFERHRRDILDIIKYLLAFPDPSPEDDNVKTTRYTIKSPNRESPDIMESETQGLTTTMNFKCGSVETQDPFSIAINTVRGLAFELFVSFLIQDSKNFKKTVKISEDVKRLYENVLKKENTRAVTFLFGYHLYSFYSRDKEWTKNLLSSIFSEDAKQKHLYLAAWEGYLANNLHKNMFFDPKIRKLYQRGIGLKDVKHPNQQHFKDPNKSISQHLALAFISYENFGFEDSLFKAFWQDKTPERHAHFVRYLGRLIHDRPDFLTRDFTKDRIKKFWTWMLKQPDLKPEPFTEFGFWINLENGIFEPKWLATHIRKTIEKTNGDLNWSYGLINSLSSLAKKSPEDTIEILRLYLLGKNVKNPESFRRSYLIEKSIDAFRTLYNNEETNLKTRKLISELLEKKRERAWCLNQILDDNNLAKNNA